MMRCLNDNYLYTHLLTKYIVVFVCSRQTTTSCLSIIIYIYQHLMISLNIYH